MALRRLGEGFSPQHPAERPATSVYSGWASQRSAPGDKRHRTAVSDGLLAPRAFGPRYRFLCTVLACLAGASASTPHCVNYPRRPLARCTTSLASDDRPEGTGSCTATSDGPAGDRNGTWQSLVLSSGAPDHLTGADVPARRETGIADLRAVWLESGRPELLR